jgi:hypothetical protein
METTEIVYKTYPSEIVISENNLLGTNLTADAGADTNTILDISADFSVSNVAVGYPVWQIDDAESATVNSVTDVTTIETSTLTGAASFSSAEYVLPSVNRYVIDSVDIRHITIQYDLTAGANTTMYLKIYGSLSNAANDDSDNNWIDMSSDILDDASGIIVTTSTTQSGLAIIGEEVTMTKYMLKLVVVNSTHTAANSARVIIKKSL